MPNWCRNEIRFGVYDYNDSDVILEEVLEFLKETIPNYNHRVNVARRAYERKLKEAKEKAGGEGNRWWFPFEKEVKQRRLFDFNNLIPYPEKFGKRDDDAQLLSRSEFIEKYGDDRDGFNSGGYEWCVANWKTKWDAVDPVWVEQHKTFHFDTAWGPSLPIVSALHKRFPTLHIYYEYYERGAAYIGGCEFIPEKDWYPEDYSLEEVGTLEQYRKRDKVPPEAKWEAGKAYNPWTSDYLGFKGG